MALGLSQGHRRSRASAGGAGPASSAGEGGRPSGFPKTAQPVKGKPGQAPGLCHLRPWPSHAATVPGVELKVSHRSGRAGTVPGKALTSLEQVPHNQESHGHAREPVVTEKGPARSHVSPPQGRALRTWSRPVLRVGLALLPVSQHGEGTSGWGCPGRLSTRVTMTVYSVFCASVSPSVPWRKGGWDTGAAESLSVWVWKGTT